MAPPCWPWNAYKGGLYLREKKRENVSVCKRVERKRELQWQQPETPTVLSAGVELSRMWSLVIVDMRVTIFSIVHRSSREQLPNVFVLWQEQTLWCWDHFYSHKKYKDPMFLIKNMDLSCWIMPSTKLSEFPITIMSSIYTRQ